jgi:hypothetical protein
LDKKEEKQNRPHFQLVRVELHPVELELIKEGKLRRIRLGEIKVLIVNKGTMNAKNARPFVLVSDTLNPDSTILGSVWGAVRGPLYPVRVEIPSYVGDSLEDIGKYLVEHYFGLKQYGMSYKRECPPDTTVAVCPFFVIEGSKVAHMTLPHQNAVPMPIETPLEVSIVMDDSPHSQVRVTERFTLKDWNEFSIL